MPSGPPISLLQAGWLPVIFVFAARVGLLFSWVRGLRVTSWWRDPATNRDVDGDPESQHLFALAVDLDGSAAELRRVLTLAGTVGLIAVREPGHVHVQLFPSGALARLGVTFPS